MSTPGSGDRSSWTAALRSASLRGEEAQPGGDRAPDTGRPRVAIGLRRDTSVTSTSVETRSPSLESRRSRAAERPGAKRSPSRERGRCSTLVSPPLLGRESFSERRGAWRGAKPRAPTPLLALFAFTPGMPPTGRATTGAVLRPDAQLWLRAAAGAHSARVCRHRLCFLIVRGPRIAAWATYGFGQVLLGTPHQWHGVTIGDGRVSIVKLSGASRCGSEQLLGRTKGMAAPHQNDTGLLSKTKVNGQDAQARSGAVR